MGKLNGYDYPDIKLSDAIELANNLKNKLRGEASNVNALAVAWGHKDANNGTFRGKLASMNKYGFLEGKGRVKLSQLAQRIVSNINEADKQEALKQVVFKIPLWKEINVMYGSNPTVQDIRLALQNITKVEPLIAEQEADKISKLYMDAVSYIKDGVNMNTPQMFGTQSQASIMESDIHQIDFEGIHIRIPKENESIETAIQLLEMLKKKELKKKKK